MSKRIKIKKNKKRNAILDAAEELIAEKGFMAMTMEEVSKKADVAKGTVYLYFKNKNSLCAALNARFNKEINHVVKKKIDENKSGSENVVNIGNAVVEFSITNPKKWKVGTELYQMEFKDLKDPNTREFFFEVNKMIHLLAEKYKQGIEEGEIRKDVDPIPAAIVNRMIFINALNPTSEQNVLLKLNKIDHEHYLSVAWGLINRSTHINPSIRVNPGKIAENGSFDQIAKEIKTIVGSRGFSTTNAREIVQAWEHITLTLVGNFEYEIKENKEDYILFHIKSCPIINSEEISNSIQNYSEGCSKYCKSVVEKLNPDYTQKFTQKICEGDNYCEGIVKLKN